MVKNTSRFWCGCCSTLLILQASHLFCREGRLFTTKRSALQLAC
jgi:hypothetical protein